MPLSSQQLQILHEMVSYGKPNYEVSQWLSSECGLNFREATVERLKAIEWFKTKDEKDKEQTISRQTSEESRTLPPKEEENRQNPFISREIDNSQAKENLFGESNSENEGIKSNNGQSEEAQLLQENVCPTEEKCVSCGDKTLACDCEVKTVEQIPF